MGEHEDGFSDGLLEEDDVLTELQQFLLVDFEVIVKPVDAP
jgi:hypothetical protein